MAVPLDGEIAQMCVFISEENCRTSDLRPVIKATLNRRLQTFSHKSAQTLQRRALHMPVFSASDRPQDVWK